MIRLERSSFHRWTIDKNVNDQSILTGFAKLMSDSKGFSLSDLVGRTVKHGRVSDPASDSSKGSGITVGVRLLQAKYYMLGYDVTDRMTGARKFMPSPMLLNCMNTDDEAEKARNFLVALFCIQYPNPANRTPECFDVYAGRLIVKLLLDERLDRRLYIDECVWFLPFIERITPRSYEELVDSILEYRSLTYADKEALFRSVDGYEYLFANVMHEMNYYFLRLFRSMGVFDIVADPSHNGGQLFRFCHTGQTYRNDAYASHRKVSGYVVLTDTVIDAAMKLSSGFSAFDAPTKQTDEDIYNRQDWYTYIYEIEPLAYLNCIDTRVDDKSHVQAVVSEMVRASKFGSRDGKEFENALKPFMYLFKETLDVEIIAGAGNTDLLCSMDDAAHIYKMNVDAKTRGTALTELNASRLMRHVRKHGAEFCMVVAPRFASGVRQDIAGSRVVVVKAEALGKYCFYECTQSGNTLADFTSIRNIIDSGMGTDITSSIEELTVSRYAVDVDFLSDRG